MEIIVFEKKAYYKMLDEVVSMIQDVSKNTHKREWVKPEEAKSLLGFTSNSKMQQLRDSGQIEFSQHNRSVKYSRKSIMKFLEKNRVRF